MDTELNLEMDVVSDRPPSGGELVARITGDGGLRGAAAVALPGLLVPLLV